LQCVFIFFTAKRACEEKEIRLKVETEKQDKLLKSQQNKKLKKQKALENGRIFIDRSLKAKAGKSKLVRVYFNQEQKQILKKWFGVIRFIYNKCLETINKDKNKTTVKSISNIHNEINEIKDDINIIKKTTQLINQNLSKKKGFFS
jgi:hypothetical protein